MLRKSLVDGQHGHLTPEADDLALVRKLALRDVKAEEVWLGRMHLANDQVDRSFERFPREYLDRFAETLPGKSLLGGHDYSSLPLGRFYKAAVQKDERGHTLDAYYYLPHDSSLIQPIELGVLKGASIGFNAGKRVCDLCGKDWSFYLDEEGKTCEHWPGDEYEGKTCTLIYCPTEAGKAEAMEGSLVWAPCQVGAEAVAKEWQTPGARRQTPADREILSLLASGVSRLAPGGTKMPTVEELQAAMKAAEASHEKALADLKEQVESLKRAAEGDDWGRRYMVAEILRMSGLLGTTASYEWHLTHLGECPPIKPLEEMFFRVGQEFNERFSKGEAKTDVPLDGQHQSQSRHGFAGLMSRLAGGQL